MTVLFICLLGACACAKKSAEETPAPTSLLPTPPSNWQKISELTFSGLALSDYINGGAEVYHAYGFETLAVSEHQDSGGARLTIEVYRMDRPENAFGVFSTDSGGEGWSIGADSSYGDGLLRFWKGPYFLRIMAFPVSASAEKDIRSLGNQIADTIIDESKRPDLLRILPPDIPFESICYFHRQTSLNNIYFLSNENLLQLGDDVEALTWLQKTAGNENRKARFIVARYPSESRASAAIRDLTRGYLRQERSSEAPAGAIVSRVKDSFAGVIPQGRHVILVLEAGSPDWVARVLEEMKKTIPPA